MRTRLNNRRHRQVVALAALGVVGFQAMEACATTYTDTWTGATNTSFYQSGNWNTAEPTGVPVPAASSGNGNDIILGNPTASSVTDTINYDQGANTNYTFNALDLSATGTGSSFTFNINSAASGNSGNAGSNYEIRSGSNNSTIGENATINVNNTSSLLAYQNLYLGGNANSSATAAKIEINSGTFTFLATNSELGIGYNGNFGQIDVGSTANSTAGTLSVSAYEQQSTGTGNNYGIGLRVSDGGSGAGTVNLNVGSVILGTTAHPSALLVGFRSVSSTGSPSGTVNQLAGNWSTTGDILIGYDAAVSTSSIAPFGSAKGTVNVSGGNFLTGASTQLIVGASNGVGTFNLSNSGVLGASSIGGAVPTVTIGGTFEYRYNFNPGATSSTYYDGPTDNSYSGATTYIAGAGTLNQSGGTSYITTLNVGSTPGTNSSTGSSGVQGTGTFNMTNGSANITTINVAANSLLSISGGTATVTNLTVGASGNGGLGTAFSFTGGTLTGLSALTFNAGSTLTLANGMSLTSVTTLTENSNTTLQWSGSLPSWDGLQATDQVLIASYTTLNNSSGANLFVLGSSFAAANAADPGMYSIDYSTPGDIYLDVTPEPASLGAISLCGVMMLRRRRRQGCGSN